MRYLLHLLLLFAFSLSLQAATFDEVAWKASYIQYGQQYLGKPWKVLPVSEFARFKKDGNRTGYETICFERRRQLAALVMAEVQERKGRFIIDIIDGLEVMMEEPWWGIPAHYGKPIPLYNEQTVDLFNAESASLIAWTGKELKSELDAFSPELYKKISREIDHRILRPALGSKYWWKTAGMNWNPWICSNWLTCVMLYENDAERRQQAVREIEGCLKTFIDSYPEDGGCDEGTGYWDRAAASLFECLYLLRSMKESGLAEVTLTDYQKEKVHRMSCYIYNMYIGNDYCVDFADAHDNRSVVQLNVLYPFALYLNDSNMKGFAAYLAENNGFWTSPAKLYDKSGNFPTLGRELMLQKVVQSLQKETPKEPTTECWLQNLQIKTMRSKEFFVAAKGGHNDESHNHNDVGSFIVYANGEPLLIDPGVGEYTSKTFSNERYSIWTMQSQYHNLPIINGIGQSNGKNYLAELKKQDKHSIAFELAKAYPAEANVKSWVREVTLKGNEVKITDNYELSTIADSTSICLITSKMPVLLGQNAIEVSGHQIKCFSTLPLQIKVDDLSSLVGNDQIFRKMWGEKLWRIRIATMPSARKGSITVRVR